MFVGKYGASKEENVLTAKIWRICEFKNLEALTGVATTNNNSETAMQIPLHGRVGATYYSPNWETVNIDSGSKNVVSYPSSHGRNSWAILLWADRRTAWRGRSRVSYNLGGQNQWPAWWVPGHPKLHPPSLWGGGLISTCHLMAGVNPSFICYMTKCVWEGENTTRMPRFLKKTVSELQ